ncbi:MAG: ATP-binding protein [Planctomycetota bacterium]|nr:ATP-binding protein [Planctomycetota bacterium]
MRRPRLFWRFFIAYVGVIVAAIAVSAFFALNQLHDLDLAQTKSDLEARTRLIISYLRDKGITTERDALNEICRSFGAVTATRITVILPDGEVAADSASDPKQMENHSDRPEVRSALSGAVGYAVRYSETLQQDMVYVAMPLIADGKTQAVVRTSLPLQRMRNIVRRASSEFLWGASALAVCAAVASFFVSRWLVRPIDRLRQSILEYQQTKKFRASLLPDSWELGILAQAISDMAANLEAQMRTIEGQKNEQQAVLASMVEGVLAVDGHERILHMNQAAEDFFEVRGEEARGKFIQEVIRHPELQGFIRQVLAEGRPGECAIVRHGKEDRHFQVRGAVLRGEKEGGAVFVFHDISRLYRLERMRRDFVANVSHELRTPVTSIQGFAETLLAEGAGEEKQRREFLEIILRQAKRLTAIVDDLLELARVENLEERGEVSLALSALRPILQSAVQICNAKAEEKRIRLYLECPEDLQASLQSELFERAIINLVDNAIKFSGEETEVRIEAAREDNLIRIRVRDQGIGIPPEHLPRIFERFYRVDKARSRKMGGTGLGLAIVKHIIALHKGRVLVQSEVGRGSTFIVELPSIIRSG